MHILLWLLMGAVVGWLADLVLGDDNGLLMNIITGVVGAFLGGLILARGNINNAPLSVSSFIVSLLGAVLFLGMVKLFRRGMPR